MQTMELLGIFVTIKPKEEALIIIDRFIHKYDNKHSFNARQDVALFKAYCYDAAKVITECFASEMWGPQRCVRRLEYFRSNDDAGMLKPMVLEAVGMLLGLRNIIVEATPIKDLPSCKRLTELSTGDAISAINDLGKNSIVKTVVCAGLLGMNIADRIEISDVEKFYMLQIEELNRERADEKREMCDIEVFLMAKYQAELGYCHQARVKTGLSIVKDIVGVIKNANAAISKYEEMVAPKTLPSLTYK